MGQYWAAGAPFYSAVTFMTPPNGASCGSGTPAPSNPGIFTPSSAHPGGVHAVFVDGSTKFLSDNINVGDQSAAAPQPTGESSYGVWGALGTSMSGEVVKQF